MAHILKIDNLLEEVRKKLNAGKYRYMGHANDRLQERLVTRLEVRQVLKNGYHEKRRDQLKEEYNSWNYFIRGKTIDGRNLGVVVSFDSPNMLIITVIDLDK